MMKGELNNENSLIRLLINTSTTDYDFFETFLATMFLLSQLALIIVVTKSWNQIKEVYASIIGIFTIAHIIARYISQRIGFSFL